jgi:hypothetical protein
MSTMDKVIRRAIKWLVAYPTDKPPEDYRVFHESHLKLNSKSRDIASLDEQMRSLIDRMQKRHRDLLKKKPGSSRR